MPFSAPTVSSAIRSQMIMRGIRGKNNKDIADAVATACSIHFLMPATISLILTGTAAGPGSYVSTPMVGVSPNGMSALMSAKALSLGWKGKSMRNLFDAVSTGIFLNLPSLIVTGVAVGVGLGVGTGKVTGFNQRALEGLIVSQCVARKIVGKNMKDLASIISNGIVNHILATSVVNVTVAGPIIPPPAGPVPVTGVPNTAQFI